MLVVMIKPIVRYLAIFFCLGSMFACAQGAGAGQAASSAPKLDTDDQKTLYALGLLLGGNIKQFSLTPEELTIVKAGMSDAVTNAKPQVELDTYGPKVNELAQKRAAVAAEAAKKSGQEFADKVAKEKDATKTTSGIVMRTITPGTGASPAADDVVKVHYEGRRVDRCVFESAVKRGGPVEFPWKGGVPCWRGALQKRKKGEKAQVVCPSSVAYGDRGMPPDIPPGPTLSFEVQRIAFHKP